MVRWFLLLLAVAAAALYFTVGIRIGVLPLTPAVYANAIGTNVYPISVRTQDAAIDIEYDLSLNAGALEARLYSLGRELWRQRVTPDRPARGRRSFPVAGGAGFNRMELRLDRATGSVSVKWNVRESL